MSSNLSPSAIHRIVFLVENDDRPICTRAGLRPTPRRLAARKTLPVHDDTAHQLREVNSKWNAIYRLYRNIMPAPPLEYFGSLELPLVLKGEVDDEDVRAIFAHGKPLEFWGCPALLVSKIVEAFTEMQKESEYLDVTITALFGLGAMEPSEAWPQAYRTHLPCYTCSTVDTVEKRSIPRTHYPGFDDPDPIGTEDFVVEKFHVTSRSFGKQLTVEVHYQLEEGEEEEEETEREQSSLMHKIAIRLTHETCSAKVRRPAIANRSSATLLLLPDFACEVFGFLDRAHIGQSLMANRDLHNLICQLKNRLPVHHLTCCFEDELLPSPYYEPLYSGAYWLTVRHIQCDLSYTDERRFKIPSTAGDMDDCALIRHYLSNSHVADLRVPEDDDFTFTIKMLASLAARNFSIGCVKFCAEDQRLSAEAKCLSDYRSMDAVFGGLRIGALHVSCEEHHFVDLVKTTDFFRMSTVQGLRELKLSLSPPWTATVKLRGRARSKCPLWVHGIYLLRNCEYYRVEYGRLRHLRWIERKVVRICEEFESGKITDTVEHFHFVPNSSSKGMKYAFNRDNLLVSGMKVEGNEFRGRNSHFEWDVYRFRNARTNEYLTACVGRDKHYNDTESVLHILKGEVYPEAWFAD